MPRAQRKPVDESWDSQRPLVLDGGSATSEEPARLGFVDKTPGTRRVLLDGFVLGMPPSANDYWNSVAMFSRKQQRWIVNTYPSESAKAYKQYVGEMITNAKKRYWTDNPLRVQIAVCFATNGVADVDNRIKPLLDALKEAQFMRDDKQVEQVEARRGPVMKKGRVIVSCWEILESRVDVLTWVKARAYSDPAR